MKNLLCFILLALFLICRGGAFEGFVRYHTKDVSNIACYPTGVSRGLMHPGEKPSFILHLRNPSGKDLVLRGEVTIKDYEGKLFARLSPLTIRIPAGKTVKKQFQAPASKEPNHYILYIDLFSGSKKIAHVQSAFTCVRPFEGKRDPFFGLDKYGVNGFMIKAYERLGAGSVGICIGRNTKQDPDVVIPNRKKTKNWQKLLNSDLNVVGALWPIVYRNKRVAQRVKAGLPPLCDEEVEHYKRYVRRLVTELKDKVKVWMVMSEYDAAFKMPAITYFSSTAVLANQVLLTRLAYREIKKIQPEAKVAVLGMMGLDYYNENPKFKITRLILDDLKKDFDLLCIDAYNGNWHSLRGPLNLPENDFRNFLKDTADLSASYGRPRTVINGEHGYSYDFRAPYDAKILHQIACFTARRLVINRSVPCMFNFWHKASHPSVAVRLDNDSTKWKSPVRDMATLWKTINSGERKRRYVEIPLLPGAAYATTARMLAFAKFSKEIKFGNDIYCYTFSNAKKEALVALWSIKEPINMILDLPCSAVLTDMVGRESSLSAGKKAIRLTQEPVYLTVKGCSVKELDRVLGRAQTSFPIPVIGGGYMTGKDSGSVYLRNRDNASRKVTLVLGGRRQPVGLAPLEVKRLDLSLKTKGENYLIQPDGKKSDLVFSARTYPVKRIRKPVFDGSGAWFKGVFSGRLSVPADVYPRAALTPEWGLFKMDGSDMSVDYGFGYDKENLYLGIRVKDTVHSQRHTRQHIWKGDMVQFAFTTRSAVPEVVRNPTDRNARLGSSDYCMGLALTANGTELYAFQNGKGPNGTLSWPAKVTRKGNVTFYEVAIPLTKLGIKIQRGRPLRFGFVVMDHKADTIPKYWLAFSCGIAGGQDVSQFQTLIFE